jgi:predicted dehydrogenase
MRYYPLVKQARSMVQAGDIGSVRLIHGQYLQDWLFLETDYNWRLIAAEGGKSRAVADIGTHWLDAVQHITGQKVVAVYADLTTFIPVRKKPKVSWPPTWSRSSSRGLRGRGHRHRGPRHHHAEFPAARRALIACQVCRPQELHPLRDQRPSSWSERQEPNSCGSGRGRPNGEFIKDPVLFYPEAAPYGYAPCGLGEGYLDTFRSVFSDFHSWILSGKPMDLAQAPFPTFLTGLAELAIVDAVLESVKSNKWVDVKYPAEAGPSYL